MEIPSSVAAAMRRIERIAAGPVLCIGEFEGALTVAMSSRQRIEREVRANARALHVDPALIDAIIASESGFDANATSRTGARGLMQLMPQTAASLGVADPYEPHQNVRGGTRYLRELLDRFGSVDLAVAAYNAGPAAVTRYGGVPPYRETQDYVRAVMARYRELRSRRSGVLNSATLR
jgi:soluble lytic murein transglycosylase-like protein